MICLFQLNAPIYSVADGNSSARYMPGVPRALFDYIIYHLYHMLHTNQCNFEIVKLQGMPKLAIIRHDF